MFAASMRNRARARREGSVFCCAFLSHVLATTYRTRSPQPIARACHNLSHTFAAQVLLNELTRYLQGCAVIQFATLTAAELLKDLLFLLPPQLLLAGWLRWSR